MKNHSGKPPCRIRRSTKYKRGKREEKEKTHGREQCPELRTQPVHFESSENPSRPWNSTKRAVATEPSAPRIPARRRLSAAARGGRPPLGTRRPPPPPGGGKGERRARRERPSRAHPPSKTRNWNDRSAKRWRRSSGGNAGIYIYGARARAGRRNGGCEKVR